MSQIALAELAGVHFTYVSSVERGERNISLENILRLAAALRTDPGDLVAGLAAAETPLARERSLDPPAPDAGA